MRHVGAEFVSRWDAMRTYGLSTEVLKKLDRVAIMGRRRNKTVGLFYPLEDVSMLAVEHRDRWVDKEMVPESRVKKQMDSKDVDLEELRIEGVWGRQRGRRGPECYWYSEETLERLLGVSVIPADWKEGEYYLPVSVLPDAAQDCDVEVRFAFPKDGRFRHATYFY